MAKENKKEEKPKKVHIVKSKVSTSRLMLKMALRRRGED